MRYLLFLVLFMCIVTSSSNAQCLDGDCANGFGTYLLLSGAKYTGTFQNGMFNGKGVCVFSDGSTYSGEWTNRLPNGTGSYTSKNGHACNGVWRNGRLVNSSIQDCRLNLLEIQTGCVIGDCTNGNGVYAYADGSVFSGDFKNAKAHGRGQLAYPDGTLYKGEFENALFQGKGVIERSDGKRTSGIWQEGERILDAPRIEGCIAGNCTNGTGQYYFRTAGALYEGSFKSNLPEGFGICQYDNGERYIGQWREGSYDGMGVLILEGGTEISGWWQSGVFAGDLMSSEHHNASISRRVKSSGKIHALIIGVASYSHMPALRYADDDAYRMYAFFRSPQGGALPDEQIELLIDEDATKRNILNAVDRLNKAAPEDIVMVYYSGHGVEDALIPIDFNGYYNLLTYSALFEGLNKCPAKRKIWISDACYSGSFGESWSNPIKENTHDVTLVMSSKPEEISLESKGLRQGVFSHFFLLGVKGLADKDNNGTITLRELSEYVTNQVSKYTGGIQHPFTSNFPREEMVLFSLD